MKRLILIFVTTCFIAVPIITLIFGTSFTEEFRYWFAVRSPNFDRNNWGEVLQDACGNCNVYYRVRAVNPKEGDILMYVRTSRPLFLNLPLGLLSEPWGDEEVAECFFPVEFNPSCNLFVENNSTNSTTNNATTNGTIIIPEADVKRKIVFSELRAEKTETCQEQGFEGVMMCFIVVETAVNNSWSVNEVEVHIGCFDTGISEDGERGKTDAVKESICKDVPSVLITLTFDDTTEYSVLLSSESLLLPLRGS
jgi:hypothetical protein